MSASDPSRGFGDAAAAYAALRPPYPPALFDFLLSRLEGPRQCAVDLGAGSGQASLALVERFADVVAVEPDARMAEHFMTEKARVLTMAAEEAEFAPGAVDAVISATAFHWMDQARICASVARWLRPGGVFFPFLYGPFVVRGPAREVYEAHRRRWKPFMDKRLGAKADYAKAISESGLFARFETWTGETTRRYAPGEAARLFFTMSYARAYAAQAGGADHYFTALEAELAAAADSVEVEFPLGGVLAVKG